MGATGHGYAREAVALLSRLAFDTLGANRVEIRCDAENTASRRVAEASGYTVQPRGAVGERRLSDQEEPQ